jgi:hypothetical protein
VSRNQRLLFAWDGLSLALCLRWDGYVAGDVPASAGEFLDVRLHRDADEERVFSVAPWPFRDAEVTVRCEGRPVTAGHQSPVEMREQLDEAELVTLSFHLRRQ